MAWETPGAEPERKSSVDSSSQALSVVPVPVTAPNHRTARISSHLAASSPPPPSVYQRPPVFWLTAR